MRITKRPFFTLLEVLVVLLILSMGAALTGVKLKQAFDEQRVYSDVQQVRNCLVMAQDMMLIMDADTEVILERDPANKEIICRLLVEKPLTKEWDKIIEREIRLTAIRSFQFDRQEQNPLRLRFTLGNMTQGTLILSTDDSVKTFSKNDKNFKIFLPGYPTPLSALDEIKEDERETFGSEGQQLYPVEVYNELYSKTKK